MRIFLLVVGAAGWWLSGCGAPHAESVEASTEEDCADDSDNDADGLADCADPDCDEALGCGDSTTPAVEEADPVPLDTDAGNRTPVADAGADVSSRGGRIPLDGSASFDPDDDELSYSWIVVFQPDNERAVFSGGETATPVMRAIEEGLYVVELTVSDGRASDADSLEVVVER